MSRMRTGKMWLGSLLLAGSMLLGVVHPASSTECNEALPDLFQRVSPAVVSISAVAIDPFRLTERVSTSIGSGFIISEDGLILTNSHVVIGRKAVVVTLDDGRKVPAKILGTDPILDTAVLKIPGGKLPMVKLGESEKARVGEEVLIIGNPFGLDQTLTRGIVSGVNRIMAETPMSLNLPLIQTDAPINPGNSGGPMLNRCGEVIGITTAFRAEAQNIGFAIPIHIASRAVPQLVKEGRVIRPWLGISGRFIKKDWLQILNLPLADGFLVETIEPGSPAQQAGLSGGELLITIAGVEFLLGGDIITAVDGRLLNSPEEVDGFQRSLKIGTTIRLKVSREGKERDVEFKVVERPTLAGDLSPELLRMNLPPPPESKEK